ncbi:hypothetical protein ES703_67422 [subsurface metagenome]
MTVESMLKGGYEGKIYPINPKGGEILGLKVYPSLRDLPETPDVAVMLIPVHLVPDVMKEVAEIGIPGVVITSAGFSEVGRNDLQEEIVRIAKENHIRIVGPNIEGLIYAPNKLHAQFYPVIENCGRLAFMTQSGSLTNGLLGWANDEGLGINACINLGNQVDICESDFLDFLAADENTGAVIMHLEGVKDGRKFIQSLNNIAGQKPVAVLKAGRSVAGKKSVVSHTASLAGSHDVFKSICRQFGVAVADDIQSLYDYGKTLSLLKIPNGNRILVISSSGGLGVLAVDEAEAHGLSIPEIPQEIIEELTKLDFANPLGAMSNPIDLATIWVDEFEKVALLVDQHDLADVFIFNFGDPIPGAGDMFIELSKKIKAGIIVSYMGGESEEKKDKPRMQKAGIPVLPTPERAIRTIAAAVRFGEVQREKEKIKSIDYQCERRVEFSDVSIFVPEHTAVNLLKQYRIPYPKHGPAAGAAEAVVVAEKLGYPVVLKVVSPDVPHKSDVGGVEVNLKDADQVRAGFANIMNRVSGAVRGAALQGVLVCKQADEGLEVIIGALDDAVFGPIIMFGLGGIYAEVLKDVSFRAAPLRRRDAEEMIREIKAYPILKGVRGQTGCDIDKLIDLLLNVSDMVIDRPEIKELDLNPVRIYENNILVLDARIMKREKRREK